MGKPWGLSENVKIMPNKPPTIRDLLDEHSGKIWSESRQENVLASDELAERVEKAIKILEPAAGSTDSFSALAEAVLRALNGEA